MKIEFFFDYLSPQSYVIWPQIKDLSLRYNAYLEINPISMLGLCEHWDEPGPFQIPKEKNFIYKDCLRACTFLGIPFLPPRIHPFNSYFLLRASLYEISGEKQQKIIDFIWDEIWGKGINIRNVEEFEQKLNHSALEIDNVIEKCEKDYVKKILLDKTDLAIEKGIYRLPSVIIGEELFYGHEQIPMIELYLRGEDPISSVKDNEIISRIKTPNQTFF